MLKRFNSDTGYKYFFYPLCAVIVLLYSYVALTSYGYDDEYFNIRMIREHDMQSLIYTIQHTDIHPPLSYILNKCIYALFRDWAFVRLFSAFLFLSSLIYLLSKTKDNSQRLILLLFLGINPTVLLWATSIRWYAYVLPLIILLHRIPDYKQTYYWWRFFIIGLIISFLGYIGLVITGMYFLVYWIKDEHKWPLKLKRIIFPAVLFLMIYAYQVWVFFFVHIKTDLENNPQQYNFVTSALAYVSSAFSNQGLFPLSVFGLISIAGMGLIMLYSLIYFRKNLLNNSSFIVYFSLSLFFIFSGIAGKVRNLFLIEPSRISFISLLHRNKYAGIYFIGLSMLVIGNVAGIYNILTHQGTTKNAWNLDMHKNLELLDQYARKDSKTFYFTHHPSYVYHLNVKGKDVVSFYNSLYFDTTVVSHRKTPDIALHSYPYDIVFIINYRGQSISAKHYSDLLASIRSVKADSVKHVYSGKDGLYKLKRKYFSDYPAYTTEFIWFYGVRDDGGKLGLWEKNQ